MTMKEIQSVEVSCFVQATEDEGKVTRSIRENLGVAEEPARDVLDGHFGNRIIHLLWHLRAAEASRVFSALVRMLDDSGIRDLERNLDMYVDEHGALYVRLNKQTMIGGVALIGTSDPIRIRIKPRGFTMKAKSPRSFYGYLIRTARVSS